MDMPENSKKPAYRRVPAVVAGVTTAVCLGMFGMSFAAVPLYRMFCAATGFAGTPQIVKTAPAAKGTRTLTVRFDANVAPGLPWSFAPETESISLRTGQTATVFFKATNESAHALAAQAMFNVTPENVGAFFDKISCFCFSEQKLGPHESAELPVVFYLDPALEKDEAMRQIEQVTLSYTFFASKTATPVASANLAGQQPPAKTGKRPL